MSFKEFQKPERIYSSDPAVILGKKGKITFSTGAVKDFELNKFNYVKLYYDEENKVMGMVFSKKEEENSIKLSVNSGGTYIYTKPFIDIFNVNLATSLRIPLTLNKKGTMYIAQIPEEKTKRKLIFKKK